MSGPTTSTCAATASTPPASPRRPARPYRRRGRREAIRMNQVSSRPLGILMLEGKMADVPGCMACEATFPYPVVRHVVRGSRTPLSAEEAWAMLPLYIEAARELEARGVGAITANCGLIALMQKELAATVHVPVVTSALLLAPAIHRLVGG